MLFLYRDTLKGAFQSVDRTKDKLQCGGGFFYYSLEWIITWCTCMRSQELVTIYQSALLSHCHTVSFSLGSSEHPSSCDSSLLQQKVQTQSATQSMGQTTSCKGFTSRSLFGTEFESKSDKSDQILYVRNEPISDSTTNKPVPGRPGGRGIWPRTRRP